MVKGTTAGNIRRTPCGRPSALRAIKHPLPPMYPGGMRIGAEEEKAVLDVLRSMAAAETRQQLKIEQ